MCELQVRLDSLEQSLELSFPQQLKEMDEAFSEMQASPFDCRRCCNCKFGSYVLNMIHYAYCPIVLAMYLPSPQLATLYLLLCQFQELRSASNSMLSGASEELWAKSASAVQDSVA